MFGKVLLITPLFVLLLMTGTARADSIDSRRAVWLQQRTATFHEAARAAARTDPEAYPRTVETYRDHRARRAVVSFELRRRRAGEWRRQADQERRNPNFKVVRYARPARRALRVGRRQRNGVDCSGLVLLAYRGARRIALPHDSGAQARVGTGVTLSVARPGDILVYSGHVSLFSGPGRMIDAPRSGLAVREIPLRTDGLRGVRRIP